MSDKAKGCPLCDAPPEVEGCVIWCDTCDEVSVVKDTAEEALKVWNTRPEEERLRQERDVARGEVMANEIINAAELGEALARVREFVRVAESLQESCTKPCGIYRGMSGRSGKSQCWAKTQNPNGYAVWQSCQCDCHMKVHTK